MYDYTGRRVDLRLPSRRDKERWEDHAHGTPLNKWILGMVEDALEGAGRGREIAQELDQLRKDNHRLREELRLRESSLEQSRTETFRLKYASLLAGEEGKVVEMSRELTQLLKAGGTWRSSEILTSLGVNPQDVDAIKIVQKNLSWLQDWNLVREEVRGWKWIY